MVRLGVVFPLNLRISRVSALLQIAASDGHKNYALIVKNIVNHEFSISWIIQGAQKPNWSVGNLDAEFWVSRQDLFRPSSHALIGQFCIRLDFSHLGFKERFVNNRSTRPCVHDEPTPPLPFSQGACRVPTRLLKVFVVLNALPNTG